MAPQATHEPAGPLSSAVSPEPALDALAVEALYAHAAEHARRGDYGAAERLLEPMSQQPSPSAALLLLLGKVYAQQERYDDAVAVWQRALVVDPSRKEAAAAIARVRQGRGAARRALPRGLFLGLLAVGAAALLGYGGYRSGMAEARGQALDALRAEQDRQASELSLLRRALGDVRTGQQEQARAQREAHARSQKALGGLAETLRRRDEAMARRHQELLAALWRTTRAEGARNGRHPR